MIKRIIIIFAVWSVVSPCSSRAEKTYIKWFCIQDYKDYIKSKDAYRKGTAGNKGNEDSAVRTR